MDWIFFLVLVVNILFSIGFFFGFGKKNGSYIYPGGKANAWSESSKKKFNLVVQWIFRIISFAIVIWAVIPMAIDIPELLSDNYMTKSGYISSDSSYFGLKVLSQFITIDANTYSVFMGPVLTEGQNISIRYLQHSKFVIEVMQESKS